MNVTFRQLNLFLSLAELKSITATARAFHVTQPTVSMQLRELTDAVGLPLYEVIGKRLSLTPAGEELAKSARMMVDELSSYEQRIDAMKGLTRGRLRVAVVSTAKYFIPRLLGAFCEQYPEIDIALEVLNRDGVVQRLRDNRDDLYIMSMPPTDIDIDQQVFLPNLLEVIAPATHRLVQQNHIQLAELATERFILREQGSGTRLACDRFFAAQHFQPQVRLELGSNEAIKQAVAGGMGISVVSRNALGEALIDDALRVLQVEGFPIHANWYIVTLHGKRLSPIASAFLAYLATYAEAKAE
ncbi:DNA-binding transcriptional LysR family regulator [Undibacterium sp. GrIS 1.8]|uniref:LysR family transcriptional regulator n=1 Tax=Undibacterium sp. GrIS 1.8 TaxID=3143934 RepID=UPI003395C161